MGDSKIDGVYYRQGPKLAYQEEDEVVYDDSYSTPILSLINKAKTKTPVEIKYLLDTNGYVGRHRLRRNYYNCCPLNEIKIDIYLVWSQMRYTWPYSGVYSLDYGYIIPDKEVPAISPELVAKGLRVLYENYACNPYTLKTRGGFDMRDAEEVIEVLKYKELIKWDRLVIVDDGELEDVIGNLFTV